MIVRRIAPRSARTRSNGPGTGEPYSERAVGRRVPGGAIVSAKIVAVSDDDGGHVPVTYEHCEHVTGPFFHGTKAHLEIGDELVAGYGSNFQEGRVSNNIYFSAREDTAAWGAELATALAGIEERGRIYVVEPLGPFEDDPNVTNKRFPGNPTESYRTVHPLRVVGEVKDWVGHEPDVLQAMLDGLARLREQGLDVIED
jgi:rifampin ADP-ribosylating transferase